MQSGGFTRLSDDAAEETAIKESATTIVVEAPAAAPASAPPAVAPPESPPVVLNEYDRLWAQDAASATRIGRLEVRGALQ